MFFSPTVQFRICRSCLTTNSQTDPLLQNPDTVFKFLKNEFRGFFSPIRLQIVDCLVNCRNFNSIRLDRKDGTILLGKISSKEQIVQAIQLAKQISQKNSPLKCSILSPKHLISILPSTQYK